jgi:large subunit ribosomal protein L33
VKITIACTETGDRNYIITKNKRTHPDRLELKKYCPRLNKHIHFIAKQNRKMNSKDYFNGFALLDKGECFL